MTAGTPLQPLGPDPSALLEVQDLTVTFGSRSRLSFAPLIRAVRGVSFSVGASETFGLVGESGSGKSTTARAVLRLVPAVGKVWLDGDEVLSADRARLRRVRQRAQMVFQDPYSSINPSRTVAEIVGEPLRTHTGLRRSERDARVSELLEQVGLRADHLRRYPGEFSGGQRQRIAIARAIATNPKLVICDEAVSALDVSTQNQVLNLLAKLRETHGVGYLFISHNLAVVRHTADRIGVMYLGRLVEVAPTARIFEQPAHPYTRGLLASMPVAKAGGRTRDAVQSAVRGELPSPARPPTGCAFHPRCPDAMPICSESDPAPRPAPGGGMVACHLYDEQPVAVRSGGAR